MVSAVAIIGTGPAGLSCAESLRRLGFDGRICLYGKEKVLPYERPALSKSFLTGSADSKSILLRDPEQLGVLDLDFQLGEVVHSVDPTGNSVRTSHGSSNGFDAIVLATGLRPRPFPEDRMVGVPNVHYLREIADAEALRPELKPGARLVLIGGGFIGLELAATAVAKGCDVTIVEVAPRLLARSAPSVLSDWLASRHSRAGVRVLTDVGVRGLMDNFGRTLVGLSDGSKIEADVLVVGIGGVPRIPEIAGTNRAPHEPVKVDADMRIEGTGLYAAGDIAELWNEVHGRSMRTEAWQTAERHGEAVAAAIVGKQQTPPGTPWFWSDQYAHSIQMLGLPSTGDRLVVRGSPQEDRFTAFAIAEDIIVGAVFVDAGRDVRPCRNAIERRMPVDLAKLRDPSIPLNELFRR